VLFDYCGGSIPVAAILKESLNVDVLSICLANQDANMHGVDENFDLGLIQKALRFAERFYGDWQD